MIDVSGHIFDLDGTLTLSQHFHYEAYALILKEHGIRYTREEDISVYAGQGSEKIFPKIFKKNERTLSAEENSILVEKKREVYQRIIETKPIEPVPGVREYLKQLKERDKKIIVATGNRKRPTETLLRRAGLDQFFKKIITAEDVSEPKPSPETFLLALKELHLAPEQCIIYEDATNGVQAAKAIDVRCIGVATGLSREKLKEAGADEAIEDFRELMHQ